MCGIAGQARIHPNAAPFPSAAPMLAALHHRGPDGQGSYQDELVQLGHTRLSIIDLEGGAQPLANEDGTVWVSFNGEIFNFIELRQSLEAAGHRFASHSDTEVLVHAYEEYGDAFLDRLNGQFCFALWDKRRRRLLLVRDRVGILPLYYCRCGDRLLFASEIKALLPLRDASPALDPLALDQLFTFWAPASPNTLFAGIKEVPPGHLLVLEQGELRESTYWDWTFPDQGQEWTGSASALADELRALLTDATRLRLRADVPVGAYLSGGLDSSALVALIRRVSGVQLTTFSLGFEDAALDEGGYQQQLVNHLGVAHHRTLCTRDDIARDFYDCIRATEMPLLRTAPVPMRRLSALVRSRGHKVVLTGEGADEVLGGYDLFKEAKIRAFWARQPDSAWRSLLLKRLYPWLDLSSRQGLAYLRNFYGVGLDQADHPFFAHLPRWQTTAQCKQFFAPELQARLRERAEDALAAGMPAAIHRWHPFQRSQYVEAKTLMAGYLLSAQGDRMLMANAVEGRFPFLDHRVIAFANRLPPRLKMAGLNEKYLLKLAMKDLLPAAILQRPKQPYRAPDIPSFFQGQPPAYVDDLLSETLLRRYGYFDPAKVALLVKKARQGRAIAFRDNMALLGILSTQIWHQIFIEGFHPSP